MKFIFMKKTISSIFIFILMIVSAIVLDYLLHLVGLKQIGRYLGIVGTIIILSSFFYSLRKRKIISFGAPKKLLQNHEFLGWAGTVLILIHSGIHFNAIIPWIAMISMLIVVASGLIGKFLYKEAKDSLNHLRIELKNVGKSEEEIERELHYSALMVSAMQQWRRVHLPLNMVLVSFAIWHIATILLYWRW